MYLCNSMKLIEVILHYWGLAKAQLLPQELRERPEAVKNIVLMSTASQTLYDIMYANLVNRTIHFAQELWDDNQDGLLCKKS
jgi:hypothetical protein